jgi:hypothetical protein
VPAAARHVHDDSPDERVHSLRQQLVARRAVTVAAVVVEAPREHFSRLCTRATAHGGVTASPTARTSTSTRRRCSTGSTCAHGGVVPAARDLHSGAAAEHLHSAAVARQVQRRTRTLLPRPPPTRLRDTNLDDLRLQLVRLDAVSQSTLRQTARTYTHTTHAVADTYTHAHALQKRGRQRAGASCPHTHIHLRQVPSSTHFARLRSSTETATRTSIGYVF